MDWRRHEGSLRVFPLMLDLRAKSRSVAGYPSGSMYLLDRWVGRGPCELVWTLWRIIRLFPLQSICPSHFNDWVCTLRQGWPTSTHRRESFGTCRRAALMYRYIERWRWIEFTTAPLFTSYAKSTFEWLGSMTCWTGWNTRKYWFTVCCLKGDELYV